MTGRSVASGTMPRSKVRTGPNNTIADFFWAKALRSPEDGNGKDWSSVEVNRNTPPPNVRESYRNLDWLNDENS